MKQVLTSTGITWNAMENAVENADVLASPLSAGVVAITGCSLLPSSGDVKV